MPPGFGATYFNGSRNPFDEGAILVPNVIDEGGNSIRPVFGPLTLVHPTTGLFFGNYHIASHMVGQSLVGNNGIFQTTNAVPSWLLRDFDLELRYVLQGVNISPQWPPDRGADQPCAPNVVTCGPIAATPFPKIR